MRMGFLLSGYFWGGALILLGGSIILNVLFNIHIPIFRICFALALIYFGIKILLGGSSCAGRPVHNTPVNSESRNHTVFGVRNIDLTGVSLASGSINKRVDTAFGSTTLVIDPEMPVMIMVNSAFGSARMPDDNIISFGKYVYRSKNFNGTSNSLIIDAKVAFGELNVIFAEKK
jgi:hypothetical protein